MNAGKLVAEDFLPLGTRISRAAPESQRRSLLLRHVKANPDGISTSELGEAAGVSGPTTLKILRELEREREVYSRSHTRRGILIWYPNGRLVHPHLQVSRELRGRGYRMSVQEGRSGPAVQIQERAYSLLSGERIEGAVFVDYACLTEFIEMLNEVKARYEESDLGRITKSPGVKAAK